MARGDELGQHEGGHAQAGNAGAQITGPFSPASRPKIGLNPENRWNDNPPAHKASWIWNGSKFRSGFSMHSAPRSTPRIEDVIALREMAQSPKEERMWIHRTWPAWSLIESERKYEAAGLTLPRFAL